MHCKFTSLWNKTSDEIKARFLEANCRLRWYPELASASNSLFSFSLMISDTTNPKYGGRCLTRQQKLEDYFTFFHFHCREIDSSYHPL